MADPLTAAMPPKLDLPDGYVVTWAAVNQTTGADVAGVVVSGVSIYGTLLGTGTTNPPVGPFMLEPDSTPTPTPVPPPTPTPPPPPPPPVGVTSYQPYLSSSAINRPIPANPPVHPDTAKMISTANHWLGTGTWLGPRARPTYYRGDTSKLPKVQMYANNNGWIGAGPFSMPMPAWAAAVIGPTSQRGDGHLVLVDSLTGDVWECWHTTPPGYPPRDSGHPSDRWNCSAYRHWPADTKSRNGYGAPSTAYPPGTAASKIHVAAGLLVPEDFADCFGGTDPGTVIPHALRLSCFCASNGTAHPRYVAPAGGGDGQQPQGIPMGAVIQLDPSKDVSKIASVTALREPWRTGMRKLLRTMQVHGLLITDSTGAPGAGLIDCASPASVAKGGDTYPVGFKYPNEVAGYGWGVANGVSEEVMSLFRVLDWR